MRINLNDLPFSIQKQIPYSIRSYKDEYDLNELPAPIQTLINENYKVYPTVDYNSTIDIKPNISEYGDFKTINSTKETVIEYLKNYFNVLPEDYPFDPVFGSRLKKYLHTRDTLLRQQLITSEVNNITNVIKADLGVNVQITNLEIIPVGKGSHMEYNINITVVVNNTKIETNINII